MVKIVKVRKLGGSLIITLPSAVCRDVQITEGMQLEVHPDNKGVRLQVHEPERVNITGANK